VVKNQWWQTSARSFVVSITQPGKKENTQIYNGFILLMENGLRPAPNALRQWEKLKNNIPGTDPKIKCLAGFSARHLFLF